MAPSILQVVLIVSGALFALMAVDAYKRGKMTLIHFVIFGVGWLAVGWSVVDASILTKVAKLFWWSTAPTDVIVYLSIIFIVYSYFELMHKITKDNYEYTRLITELALQSASIPSSYTNKNGKDNYMFLVKWYNEGKILSTTLSEIIEAGYHKILFVNDGSRDNTINEVEAIKAKYPHALIVLISHMINRRHGAGNKTAIEFFRRYGAQLWVKYVVFFDADWQMDIRDMKIFEQEIHNHPEVDVIQWSRFIKWGKAESIPLHRQIILWGANIVTLLFNGMKVTDPHNGYKVFKLSALQKITIHTDTTSYANELIDQYQIHWLNYREVPVHIRYTDYSLHKGQKSSNAINILVELIYKKIFFR
jgi:hypothetical protein